MHLKQVTTLSSGPGSCRNPNEYPSALITRKTPFPLSTQHDSEPVTSSSGMRGCRGTGVRGRGGPAERPRLEAGSAGPVRTAAPHPASGEQSSGARPAPGPAGASVQAPHAPPSRDLQRRACGARARTQRRGLRHPPRPTLRGADPGGPGPLRRRRARLEKQQRRRVALPPAPGAGYSRARWRRR